MRLEEQVWELLQQQKRKVYFEFTKEIIGAEKLAKFEEIKAKLMAGEIKVSDK